MARPCTGRFAEHRFAANRNTAFILFRRQILPERRNWAFGLDQLPQGRDPDRSSVI